jgi:AcrR family transcriptional regulator
MTPAGRMKAEERREGVLRAAGAAFAEGGYRGTTTEEVARRAGISQPYIFRLFGSKKELFIAVVQACFERTVETFEKASQGLDGTEALYAMGAAYGELIQDPAVLLVEMHAFAASVYEPDVRRVAQRGMRAVWQTATKASGLGSDAVREWLSMGMMWNVVAALGLEQLDEQWAKDVAPIHKECPPGINGTLQ